MFSTTDRQVAIFWDMENCAPPNVADGYQIIASLRAATERYGPLMVLRAYMEVNLLSQKSSTLRTELQSSGVTLVDCPHSGLKDVVDKMIIVDVAFHAAAHPADTIVLISGDRDYAYLVSSLRLRRHNVIIIGRPKQIHGSLMAHASEILDWNVLTSPNSLVTAPYTGFTNVSSILVSKDIAVGNLLDDELDDYASYGSINSGFPPLEPSFSDLNTVSLFEKIEEDMAPSSYDKTNLFGLTDELIVPVKMEHVDFNPTQVPLPESEQAPSERSLTPILSTLPLSERDTQLRGATPVVQTCQSEMTMPSPQISTTLSATPLNLAACTLGNTHVETQNDMSRPLIAPLSLPSTSQSSGLASSEAPRNFQLLVDLLVTELEKGNTSSPRSIIAEKLIKTDPSVYKKAGVTSWKRYADLAVEAGIVTLGGTGGGSGVWIALKLPPNYVPLVSALRDLQNRGGSKPARSAVYDLLLKRDAGYLKKSGFSSWSSYADQAEKVVVIALLMKAKTTPL